MSAVSHKHLQGSVLLLFSKSTQPVREPGLEHQGSQPNAPTYTGSFCLLSSKTIQSKIQH